jgi:hypothetical protein
MWKCHREFRQKSKTVPAESWGTFVGYCVTQLIAVYVLHTEIKYQHFLNKWCILLQNYILHSCWDTPYMIPNKSTVES